MPAATTRSWSHLPILTGIAPKPSRANRNKPHSENLGQKPKKTGPAPSRHIIAKQKSYAGKGPNRSTKPKRNDPRQTGIGKDAPSRRGKNRKK